MIEPEGERGQTLHEALVACWVETAQAALKSGQV